MTQPRHLALLAILFALPASAAEPLRYNRDVRPILSENCFFCHGPDKAKRKAKLRLDDRESAIEKGAIAPGKLSESELIARIRLKAGEDGAMPPPESHKVLTPKQKEILAQWIEEGAKYEPHWAYAPLVKPQIPVSRDAQSSERSASSRNAIDAFIDAELAKRNLKRSPEANPRTLVRRVYLDLLGLPPTEKDVAEFLNDHREHAYEHLVDKLLASEAFGERMAVMWLDMVRFADTVGYHGDQNQRIFPYRDYVINAFNANKPFDQFTREQIAGDLLPKPTTEQLVATGFNRLNMMTREGGAQPKEYIAKYQADRVRTVSLAWLGSTMGCAECHDHKFDPFTAKDFYSMEAFFADIKQWGVYSDYSYTPNPDLKGWTNDHPFPPEIEVESTYLKNRKSEIDEKIYSLVAREYDQIQNSKNYQNHEKKWSATIDRYLVNKTGWVTPVPQVDSGSVVQADGSVLIAAKAAKGASTNLTVEPPLGWLNSIRLELLPHAKHGNKITRDAADSTTVQLVLSLQDKNGKTRSVPLFYGEADNAEPIRYISTAPVLGFASGWRTSKSHVREAQSAVWILDKPLDIQEGDQMKVVLKSDDIGCVRMSLSCFPWPDFRVTKFLEYYRSPETVGAKLKFISPDRLFEMLGTDIDPKFIAEIRPLLKEKYALTNGKAWTQITVAQPPVTTRLLPRGNWMDESAPIVLPATPGFLGGPASTEKNRLTRLDLANWLVSKENPLTARVFVNRLWKLFIGTGLSASVEDIGAQGEWPSHPELLDWMASEFQRDWNVKNAVKRIVLSQTYRQSSNARPEALAVDSGNRLLSFLPPRRLEAEFVRDNALAIAGLLNRDIGGPSVKPYQPAGYYANIQFPSREYKAETDNRQYRRGLYVHWQRTFLHPMLANFDAPSREECTAVRSNANTPQQALTLLNDPTFVEAARVLAEKVYAIGDTDEKRIDWLFERVLARLPQPAERETLMAFANRERSHFNEHPEDAKKLLKVGLAPVSTTNATADLAAWTSVCRVVLNLHETITRY